jgi:hypothetical protein
MEVSRGSLTVEVQYKYSEKSGQVLIRRIVIVLACHLE